MGINRVVSLTRYPRREGHGLCGVSVTWTLPEGSDVIPQAPAALVGSNTPPEGCAPVVIAGESGGASLLIQHKSDNTTLIAAVGVGVLLVILILVNCCKSKAPDHGYYPPQDMGGEPYYPPDDGRGYDQQYHKK